MARVAVVTGGTRGIGEAISVALKDAGFIVAANYAGNDERASAIGHLSERTSTYYTPPPLWVKYKPPYPASAHHARLLPIRGPAVWLGGRVAVEYVLGAAAHLSTDCPEVGNDVMGRGPRGAEDGHPALLHLGALRATALHRRLQVLLNPPLRGQCTAHARPPTKFCTAAPRP